MKKSTSEFTLPKGKTAQFECLFYMIQKQVENQERIESRISNVQDEVNIRIPKEFKSLHKKLDVLIDILNRIEQRLSDKEELTLADKVEIILKNRGN